MARMLPNRKIDSIRSQVNPLVGLNGPSSPNKSYYRLFILLLAIVSFKAGPSHQQSSISLNNAPWTVSNANGSIILSAQVPGGIYSDLRRNDVLKQDILYGRNDLSYRWVGQENWTYTTAFAIDQQIATSQSVKLVLHGVDTVSKVYLNGEEIGSTDSMFVRYKFDIKPHLRLAGLKNVLVIKFESPLKYSARKSNQSIRMNRGKIIPPYCPPPAQRGECHVNFIRKMQASYSWDWGPAFPSMGIYKDIEIDFGSFATIRDILVETRRLAPLVPPSRHSTTPAQVIISSSIRHNVQVPTINKTVPYIRAPPYYLGSGSLGAQAIEQLERIDLSEANQQQQQVEENWLLKVTLVSEMAQPSFGYNLRVEFDLNGVLHYESEHINVIANSDGYIRLGFNLRIDPSRLRVKSWWPNNAGAQNLYRLTARVMPIPNAPDKIRFRTDFVPSAADVSKQRQHLNVQQFSSSDGEALLQARSKPLQTPATPSMSFLLSTNRDSYQAQYVSDKTIKFGFRTVELIQEPITLGNLDDGLTYEFKVNGVNLFAMGSNWIPNSVLPENSNDLEYIRYLLQSAKDANMNMLRVWGGGIYESNEFYQMADEMGIMIWQDFMFACALYPVDDEFISAVRLEIEQQVQRLQYHPSIVLWAGNNENEVAISSPWWPEVLAWNKKLRESYYKLYVETIKPIVKILDPTRAYVESSPSNGIISESQPYAISKTPNDNKYGDVHHYDYSTDLFEWSNYPSTRFASEYGFQSYPSFNALTSVTTSNDWKYPLTANILHRQHNLLADVAIKSQIKQHFNEPKSGGVDKFKAFLYTSQLSQAIAIKTQTEFYRRNRFIDPETKLGKTMGALYWQLNDVWPAPTWSSIEYGGKWKILHNFARRFFFPIQVVPYLVRPPPVGSSSPVSSTFQQANQQASSSVLSLDPQQQQQQHQSSSVNGPLLVVDLVRDDLFDLLDSFNVTIRFYRWTSFTPVWQDTIYVRNTRPQNVTRIYEQDLMRIARQPGVISISSGVFQVLIEQQPRAGLSQIENYLMPVYPNKVTAMRVAKIDVELIQGPFELADVGGGSGGHVGTSSQFAFDSQHAASNDSFTTGAKGTQWSCGYRLTLVSDSIAMFVWLDLNLLNIGAPIEELAKNHNAAQASSLHHSDTHSHKPPSMRPQIQKQQPLQVPSLETLPQPPDHIRLQMSHGPYHQREVGPQAFGEAIVSAASDTVESKSAYVDTRNDDQQPGSNGDDNAEHQFAPDDGGQVNERFTRQVYMDERDPINRAPDKLMLSIGGAPGGVIDDQQRAVQANFALHNHQSSKRPYKAVDASGGDMLRFQFSDNAFNMFEPSKVVDLYLNKCLTKAQIEIALEIQSLADTM